MDVWTLVDAACDNYNGRSRGDYHAGLPCCEYTDDNFDEFVAGDDFLCRITVNYLRHATTSYDSEFEVLFGRTGVGAAIDRMRSRIFEAISDAYEFLEDECSRQEFGKT